MILYVDSSSIVAVHLREPNRHNEVLAAIRGADAVACSLIAYAEVRAALARARLRESPPRITQRRYREALQDFEADWPNYIRVAPSEELIRLAGGLAEKHVLRGYDSVHLASAIDIRNRVPETIVFSAWDERQLTPAATGEGFALAHPAASP